MQNYFNTAQNIGYVDGVKYVDHNQWKQAMAAKGYQVANTSTGSAQNGGGAGGQPVFNFDWTQADQDALDKLAPYYSHLLDIHNGDVNLAKNRLEEDYQSGLRQATETQQRENTYGQQDYQTQMQQEDIQNEQDLRDTRGKLNNQGVLVGQISPDQQGGSNAPVSGFAEQYYLSPMSQQQQLRKQAIDRALQRQREVTNSNFANTQQQLATTKQRGIENTERADTLYKENLNQEKQDKAINQMAPLQYQQEYQKYKFLNNIP